MYGYKLQATSNGLFLSFLVFGVRLAPLAIFLEFYLALYELPILARPIVGAATLLTCDFYELILRHEAAL